MWKIVYYGTGSGFSGTLRPIFDVTLGRQASLKSSSRIVWSLLFV